MEERGRGGKNVDCTIGSGQAHHDHVQNLDAKSKTPTPSDLEGYALEDAREAALDLWKEWDIQLQDASSKLEHWKDYYEDELKTYRQCVEDGEIDVAKSVFDVTMLQGEQVAIADLIRAE
jgi:hypothetical protein